MRTEQLKAILQILEESDQEDVKMYFEKDGEQTPVVCTIKQGGVLQDQLVSLVFYEDKS